MTVINAVKDAIDSVARYCLEHEAADRILDYIIDALLAALLLIAAVMALTLIRDIRDEKRCKAVGDDPKPTCDSCDNHTSEEE